MTEERRRRSDSPSTSRSLPTHPQAPLGAHVTILVVKIGGRAQGDPRLARALAAATERAGTRLIVVHGGGDEVSALQRQMGLQPEFVGGRRVTSAQDLELVRMVLSGAVNKRLVAQLHGAGLRAVGLSGEDGGLLTARVDPTFGRVGREVLADVSLIAHLVNGGWVPVISPLALERDSSPPAGLNVNGDDAAAAIAEALGADELVFVADVEGVLEGGKVLPELGPDDVAGLTARGVAQGGMLAKLEASLAALRNGVRRVRIASLDGIADRRAGTSLTLSPSSSRGPA